MKQLEIHGFSLYYLGLKHTAFHPLSWSSSASLDHFLHRFHSPWIILEYGKSCGALVKGSGQHIFSCSIFVFLKKKKKRQILGTLQCLYIRVCARVCVCKQEAHIPMIHVFLLEISDVDMLEKLGT